MTQEANKDTNVGDEYLHKKMVEEAAPTAGMLQEEIDLLLHCFPLLVGKDVFGFKGLIHW